MSLSNNIFTKSDLQEFQGYSLRIKLKLTQQRIREWVDFYGLDGVYISFSGGKDSTVLMDIGRKMYKDIHAVYFDTGLEFPQLRTFVKQYDNVEIIKPSKLFRDVVLDYGYPMISKEASGHISIARNYLRKIQEDHDYTSEWLSLEGICNIHKYWNGDKNTVPFLLKHANPDLAMKNSSVQLILKDAKSRFSLKRYVFFLDATFEISKYCCDIMKKQPAHKYNKRTGMHPITAQMASESLLRTQKWLQNGCNAFNSNHPISNPMSFWTEQDVLLYIYLNQISIASPYGRVYTNDKIDDKNKLWDLGLFDIGMPYMELSGMSRTGCMFCGFGCQNETEPTRWQILQKTNPNTYEMIMRDIDKGGLGLKSVIDWCNKYGYMDIRYKEPEEYYPPRFSCKYRRS